MNGAVVRIQGGVLLNHKRRLHSDMTCPSHTARARAAEVTIPA